VIDAKGGRGFGVKREFGVAPFASRGIHARA